MPLLTAFFKVCYAICANLQILTCCRNNQNNHGLSCLIYISSQILISQLMEILTSLTNSISTFLHLDLFDFCYAEAEKELDGQMELIGEDEADALYGVSNIFLVHEQCQ